MKKTYIQITLVVLVFVSLLAVNKVKDAYAQSFQTWSPPINLSTSGASSNPIIIVDQNGGVHVLWVDEYDGYKYVQSADGVTWTSPKAVNYPFDPKLDSAPTFLVNPNGLIYVFWRSEDDALFYGYTTAGDVGNPFAWKEVRELVESTSDFDVVADDLGTVYLSYTNLISTDTNPAGIYYRRLAKSGWSSAVNLYDSDYFRSLPPENSHVQIAVSNSEDDTDVYVVWDDRPQKRVFMARSSDGGQSWSEPVQIKGPEETSGIEIPYNINLTVDIDQVLVTWQLGLPGSQCTQYSQLSMDKGASFEAPVKLLGDFSACPQQSNFIAMEGDYSMIYLRSQDDFSLVAWNGAEWSEAQIQDEISIFINPATFESVLFGCQSLAAYGESLFVVGCDQGGGGDIWFSSRPLGSITEWFPPPSAWSSPISITNIDLKVSSLISVSQGDDSVHDFWIQSPLPGGVDGKITVQYSRWDGEKWSNPISAISGLEEMPLDLTASADDQGRLILAWVDGKTGEILFSWSNAERANRVSEWSKPLALPLTTSVHSAPDMLVDAAGKLVVVYAVPVNERRGIYLIESEDFGFTWSQPYQVFDAVSAGWQVADQPKVSLTADGRLHVLFGNYSLQGDHRRSIGLYYSQSVNGGEGWSEPEMVSEQVVSWSELVGYNGLILHRLWQEKEQSAVSNFHQVSQDGGMTWESPAKISSANADASQVLAVKDQAGGLYVIQLSDEADLSILVQKWDGLRWSAQEASKKLSVSNPEAQASIAASLTAKGYLLASILLDDSDAADEVNDRIVGLGRFVELPGNVQASLPVYVATSAPTVELLVSENNATPTAASPLANISDTSSTLSRNRNIVGILLLGGILTLIVVVLRPKKKRDEKLE